MKNALLALCLSLTCVLWASGQDVQGRATGSSSSETSATTNTGNIQLENATRLSGELQKTLDVRKAKVGDEVVLKTTQAIKSNGRVVVDKGARLFGRVTEVAKSGSGRPSRIGLLFNRLEHGTLAVPITASISSITHAATSARVQSDDGFGGSAASSTRSSSSTNSGALVGVGGVISSTTAVLGSTVNSTTNAVGTTASGLGSSIGTIQISQSSNTSAHGESVLSSQAGNLRLEKGTRFNLVVSQSANASTGQHP